MTEAILKILKMKTIASAKVVEILLKRKFKKHLEIWKQPKHLGWQKKKILMNVFFCLFVFFKNIFLN